MGDRSNFFHHVARFGRENGLRHDEATATSIQQIEGAASLQGGH
jgi:hypothetical protein